jgi:hypothetical protein
LQQEFVKDIVARLERTGVVYAITGSIASNVWGLARTTHDIDIVVVLAAGAAAGMAAAFDNPYYVSVAAIDQAILTGGMFNVIDTAHGIKADFWVTRQDAFNASMLGRRRRLEIVPGQPAFVGSAEDILLHKLVWHTITPSERQLGDAAGIAAVQGANLDLAYLREWAGRQGTTPLLDEVLQGKHLKKT